MRRSSLIFLAAILLPSLALAWMAVRSARDQQVILEHQQTIISQDITDSLAKMIQQSLDDSQSEFIQATQQLLQKSASPQALAKDFNRELPASWNLAEVGFAVNVNGTIYSPMPRESTVAKLFRDENDRFLSNRENVEVFAQMAANRSVNNGLNYGAQQLTRNSQHVQPQQAIDANQLTNNSSSGAISNQSNNVTNIPPLSQAFSNRSNLAQNNAANLRNQQQTAQQQAPNTNQNTVWNNGSAQNLEFNNNDASQELNNNQQATQVNNQAVRNQRQMPQQQLANSNQNVMQQQTANNALETNQYSQAANIPPAQGQSAQQQQIPRQVVPQQFLDRSKNTFSNSIPEESDFRKLIGNESSGALARFREDKLRLMIWYRPPAATSLVFGAQLSGQKLVERLQPLLQSPDLQKSSSIPYCLAILDDSGKSVASSTSNCTNDWKHPLVATEIGDGLPHWEAALYLIDPQQLNRSASTLRLALASIVTTLLIAILLGGWLISADVRRQMLLAQQKTDFVSNVSHELKTPLTSIRMFADMLAEGRVAEKEKQSNYLRIISAESARLTRLINNVLVFARMERGTPSGEKRPCDLAEIAQESVATCRPHIESAGISLALDLQTDTLPLLGERDALAQIILNLLSNAEKYGGKEIQVVVRKQATAAKAPEAGCIDVLDRGPGISSRQSDAIFEPFHRLDNSLASGISGSGLGLTLARRMARAHGGDVTYSARADGGSCFTLCVPLTSANGTR